METVWTRLTSTLIHSGLVQTGFIHTENREVGDWRKNIDALSGMEGRKKKFETSGAGQA